MTETNQNKPAQRLEPKRLSKIYIAALLVGLVLLMLALTGCSYPGGDPPCQGANAGAPGCTNPVGNLSAQPGNLPWYVDWAFQIIKSMIASIGITAVQLSVSVFWLLFTNLSSTDFYACTISGGGSNPTCATASAFAQVRTIAWVMLPLILSWKIFKSYFIGGLVPPLFESAISFLTKIAIGALVLSQLEVIVSSAFGLSNILFNAILGNPQNLSQLASSLIGNNTSGVLGLGQVTNIGLLFVLNTLCIVVAIIFVLLGVVFLLRTVIVFILMVISPLAIMAGLTDEFKSYFYQWLGAMQAMLIAPLPAAICFRLVTTYVTSVPNPNADPAGFLLKLIYIASFLSIGGILMFKIAGQAGEMIFGVVVGAIGALVGVMAGGGSAVASTAASNSSGGAKTGNNTEGSVGSGVGQGQLSYYNSGGGGVGGMAVGAATTVSGNGGSSGGGWSSSGGEAGAASFGGYDMQQRQQAEQMTRAIRSLSETLTASRYEGALDKLYRSPAGVSSGGPFHNYEANRNTQSLLHAAGRAAGISNAPHVTFVPAGRRAASSNPNPDLPGGESESELPDDVAPQEPEPPQTSEVTTPEPPLRPLQGQVVEEVERSRLSEGAPAPRLPGPTWPSPLPATTTVPPSLPPAVSRLPSGPPPSQGYPGAVVYVGPASASFGSGQTLPLPPPTPQYDTGGTIEAREIITPIEGSPNAVVVTNVLTDPYGSEDSWFDSPGSDSVSSISNTSHFQNQNHPEVAAPIITPPPAPVVEPTSSKTSPFTPADTQTTSSPRADENVKMSEFAPPSSEKI